MTDPVVTADAEIELAGQGDSGGRFHSAQERIASFVTAGEWGGGGLAVAHLGLVILEWYAGEATPGRPAGPDTIWPICSLTKPFTAATAMALVEEGRLTLGQRVCDVLPWFSGGGREDVRVRHLLTHTAGLVDNAPDWEPFLEREPFEALLRHGASLPLATPPGERFAYSDLGYGLLGHLIGVVDGGGLAAAMRRRILEPADILGVYPTMPLAEQGRWARPINAQWPQSPADWAVWRWENGAEAAGAVLPDLLRFGLLFAPSAGHAVLSPASIRTMTTDQTGGEAVGQAWGHAGGGLRLPQPWGAGFHIRGRGFGVGDLLSDEGFGHGGATGCWLAIEPSADVVIAVVSNAWHTDAADERWVARIGAVLNAALAAATRP